MKHYVIPTDFSEQALVAAKFALTLAKKNRASISIVHAYRPFYATLQASVYFTQDEERAEQQADRQMKQFLQKLQRLALYRADDPLVQAVCINGSLVRALNRFHEANEIDLLIMGVGSLAEDKEGIIGATIAEISNEVAVPLLVLPSLCTLARLKKIAFFTQFEPSESEVLKFLIAVFGIKEVSYRLLALQKNPMEENNSKQLRLAKWAAILCKGHDEIKLSVESAVGREIVALLDGVSRRAGFDVLVVTPMNEKQWKNLTGLGLVNDLLLNSPTALLIF